MGGGTLQLVIQGGQDIYITGNPEKSFFKSVYRRHTNFLYRMCRTSSSRENSK